MMGAERYFTPEKQRCRPPSGWGLMPAACFSAPPPGGFVEGASDLNKSFDFAVGVRELKSRHAY